MKKNLISGLTILALLGLVTCAVQSKKAKMRFYHGPVVPDVFISVVGHTAEVIEFKIRTQFVEKHAYHLVLDGNDPISEGWFPTARVQTDFYTVKMKAKKGAMFQSGKEYRLCIGTENPQYVYVYSSNYPCLVDYKFVLD